MGVVLTGLLASELRILTLHFAKPTGANIFRRMLSFQRICLSIYFLLKHSAVVISFYPAPNLWFTVFPLFCITFCCSVELVRNVVAHGDAREGKWRGNWRMEWVSSTLTIPRNMVYPALLKLMRTPRLPAIDWTAPPPIKMDSSVSGKDELWFLRVCHQVPHELYCRHGTFLTLGDFFPWSLQL